MGTECLRCHEWVRPVPSGYHTVFVNMWPGSWLGVAIEDSKPEYICPVCGAVIDVAA